MGLKAVSGSKGGSSFTNGSQIISGAAGTLTVANNINYVFVDASGGVVSFALPAASGSNNAVVVKDYKGKAATNNITATVASSGTIDGQSSIVFNVNYESITFVDNGSSWSII